MRGATFRKAGTPALRNRPDRRHRPLCPAIAPLSAVRTTIRLVRLGNRAFRFGRRNLAGSGSSAATITVPSAVGRRPRAARSGGTGNGRIVRRTRTGRRQRAGPPRGFGDGSPLFGRDRSATPVIRRAGLASAIATDFPRNGRRRLFAAGHPDRSRMKRP